MASAKINQWKADPNDLFPYRGQYGGRPWGAIFFVSTRTLLVIFTYSVLAPPNSPWSLFSQFPSAAPSRPPPTDTLSLPGVPDAALRILENALGMSSYNSLVFLSIVLSSIEFTFYNLLWRRERFPMTGQGGALMVATQVQIIDMFQVLLFVYTASRNPSWSAVIFQWMPMLVMVFVVLHGVADHSKYAFRKNSRNEGKIYMGGMYGVVRHPNFLGFFLWRVFFATMCGGFLLGLALAAMFVNFFMQISIPGLEGYLSSKYGRQWELYKENVKYKIFPGLY